MDCLAAQKALVAKRIRNGKIVPTADLRNIASRMHDVSRSFAALWKARNKPSRLKDNLALFKQVENEALELSRR
jgi:hypothetical protein